MRFSGWEYLDGSEQELNAWFFGVFAANVLWHSLVIISTANHSHPQSKSPQRRDWWPAQTKARVSIFVASNDLPKVTDRNCGLIFFLGGGITSLLLSKSKFSMLLQWTSLKLICKCPAYNTPHLLSSCGHFKMVKYKLCLHHRILLRSFSGPLVLGSNLSWAQSLLCRLTFPQGLKSCWERSLWVVH